jgi:hypothetical protein
VTKIEDVVNCCGKAHKDADRPGSGMAQELSLAFRRRQHRVISESGASLVQIQYPLTSCRKAPFFRDT